MIFKDKNITLKDGRTAILRPGKKEDAPGLIDYLKTATAQTEFLLRAPDECDISVENEERWVQSCLDDPDCMMIVVEVDGQVAGNGEIRFYKGAKTKHRANIGIGLKKAYWGLGIGTAIFTMLEEAARSHPGTAIMELEFIEGNSRARALYEKMGFCIVGMRPDAFRLSDRMAAEYIMQKRL